MLQHLQQWSKRESRYINQSSYITQYASTIEDYNTMDKSSFIIGYLVDEQKKALFNVVISDETMAFEGVKVGMKKNTAHKKLISKGWYITDNSNEDIAYYEKEDAGELFWVGFENGLVRAIEYVPVDD